MTDTPMTDPDLSHVGSSDNVGDIVTIDSSVIKELPDDAVFPVICPIGFCEHNDSYNINAEVVPVAGKRTVWSE